MKVIECDCQFAGETLEAVAELVLATPLNALTETQWNRIRVLQDALLNAERGNRSPWMNSSPPQRDGSSGPCPPSTPPVIGAD